MFRHFHDLKHSIFEVNLKQNQFDKCVHGTCFSDHGHLFSFGRNSAANLKVLMSLLLDTSA